MDQKVVVGIDPNMYFTALCKIKGKKILKWGLVDWTPKDYPLMYERLSEYIDDNVDQVWVEQQMNRPMEFRSGVLIGMSTALGARKVATLNGHKYKNAAKIETGNRETNKQLVVNLTKDLIEDYFGDDKPKRVHDLADAYFIANFTDK
jgi:hypothetical protein